MICSQDKLDVLQMYKMEAKFEKLRALNASVSYELNNVNRFFYQDDLPVKSCMKAIFDNELYSMNFKNDAQFAKNIINEWVSNQTKYQINDLLSDGDVSDETKLILVSAAKSSSK